MLLEPLEPAAGGLHAPAGVGGKRQAFDQPGDPIGVSGRLGMVNGQLQQSVGFAPCRRPDMQLLGLLGLGRPALGAKQLAEQVVVVVPLPSPVERYAQQI